MGVRNQKLESSSGWIPRPLILDSPPRFEQGLNCSPFEAEAVLDVVKEVYFPFLSSGESSGSAGQDHSHRRRG